MARYKTALEKAESVEGEAERLRHALFQISRTDSLDDAKNIAIDAMSGVQHRGWREDQLAKAAAYATFLAPLMARA